MHKTILITGSTDGIGLATARALSSQGHAILLHGRNPAKLATVEAELKTTPGAGTVAIYTADLSRIADVNELADAITSQHQRLDVLINNAGVFHMPDARTSDGLDKRFVVNAIAPWRLTQGLLPLLGSNGRVINLSSAAQAPVNLEALAGRVRLSDMAAYAQSKLALTMWSRHLAQTLQATGPVIVAVNPGSMLATRMVKEGFGVAGNDINIGASILVRAALTDEFADASGRYFDNDAGRFADPHADALDPRKSEAVVRMIEEVLLRMQG